MENLLLQRNDWNPEVKNSLNSLMKKYGKFSENFNKPYCVFDFDNTTTIFDSCENLLIYQFENMNFAFTPDNIRDVLYTGLGDRNTDLTHFGYGKGSYTDWVEDIATAYTHLYDNYGPFTPSGKTENEMNTIKKDEYWLEFCVKYRALYDLIGDNESTDVSYPWIIYIFTGFTEKEIYDLSYKAFCEIQNLHTKQFELITSGDIKSRTGIVKYNFVYGISVTDNIKELWKCLCYNGFDIWICSASEINLVRGAIDAFGLHNYITGLMGMSEKFLNGKAFNEYDYTNAYAFLKDGPDWKNGDIVVGAQTQGKGKVSAINNVCVLQYGHGPIACFGDSTGDYNFCTEYAETKLVCIFNRANRKVTDGGSLLAELAVYQNDILGIDFDKCDNIGDIKYVLQGRNENDLRTFIASKETLRFAKTEKLLFAEDKSVKMLDYFIKNNYTTEYIVNNYCKINDKNDVFDFDYGFLREYNGYKSIK